MHLSLPALVAPALLAASATARFVIYADEWHPTRPTNAADRAGVDHVVLAFAMANATAAFQPKVPISTIRSEFPNAKIMIAVGGWGDDIGFFQASKTDASIQQFAAGVATMLTNTGADGVDIDWEYPGGNGADYKQVPNSDKAYQIDAFPKFLAATRAAIGNKLLSIAVPGKRGDMMAYTKENGPKIWSSVDYINVMSYDLMNRRDEFTKHHTSVAGSAAAIKRYLAIGAPPEKINLGFAYYAKYFTTQGDCSASPLNCPIVLAEDPVTGKDTLTSGAWTFEKFHMLPVDTSSLTISNDGTCGPEKGTKCATGCCSQYGNCGTTPEHCSGACQHAFGTGCTDSDVAGSWQKAMSNGMTDRRAGGQYYFDPQNRLFWTWDTPELISRKFDEIVNRYGLGGVMAWSLGEDSFDWSHMRQMATELKKRSSTSHQSQPMQAPSTNISPSTSHEMPEMEQGPVADEAPHIEHPYPHPRPHTIPVSKNPSGNSYPSHPYSVVWVDGTSDGPQGDHSTEPGSPGDYAVPYKPSESSPAQEQNVPAVPQPAAPVQQQATQPTSDDDLPFSPEYEAAIRAVGGNREVAGSGTVAAGRACRLKKRMKKT